MKAQKILESHFSKHWLPWLALYHFLPVCNLRDVACGMVESMSRGELTLDDIFHEQLSDSGAISEAWVIAPKPVAVPLASYLQNRIRALLWNNDSSAHFESKADWNGVPVHPSLVEAVVKFGSNPESFNLEHPAYSLAEHPELVALAKCLQGLSQGTSPENAKTYTAAIENSLACLEMPLRAAALKFAGDHVAFEDRWHEAEALYERVLFLLSSEERPASPHFLSGLTTVTVQSLATASRVLGGKQRAAEIFDSVKDRWPTVDPILFAANASHESLVVHTNEKGWSRDNRTSVLQAPLLISTHDIEAPILDFLESDFSNAHDAFLSRLRRHIALGAGREARVTKAVCARSIFSSLTAELQTRRNKEAFSIATCFLIDGGNPKLASNIEWNKDLVELYVDDAMIQLVQDRSAAFDGVLSDRRLVAIELLSGWAMQLPPDASGLAALILRQLAQFAESSEATSNPSTNISGRSLKALKQIGTDRPEWLRQASQSIAAAIVARLNEPGWWTGMQEAAEVAIIYASAFDDKDLASVVKAAVHCLGRLDPGFWMVIRPLQEFIICERAGEFIHANKNIERQVVELLLRHCTAEGGDRANLMHSLRTFDPGLLNDPELQIRLQEVIKDIKGKAGMTNSSASLTNIQALLSAPALAEHQGVQLALNSLQEIIGSANSKRHNVSLTVAYYPLLQISIEHEQIAKGIGLSSEEFIGMLKPLSILLEDLWMHAASDPTMFVSFSIPPNQVPNPVTVHNWTFVSMQFAQLVGNAATVEAAIDAAARAQPSLAKTVVRAKTIKQLSSGEESFDEDEVRKDNKEVFYLNIGSRLSLVDTSTDEGRARTQLLLQKCLQHGPNDLDIAVFILAQRCGLSLEEHPPGAVAAYMERLMTTPDRRLNFLPLLKLLGYKQELP